VSIYIFNMLIWWDLKKVVILVGTVVAIAVIILLWLGTSSEMQIPQKVDGSYSYIQQKGLTNVVKLRVAGDVCMIRIDTPPVPYDVNWTLISPEFTSPGAGGYYAYLLLINETSVAIAPAIARAYNSALFFVFKCTISDGKLVYEASPTFVNNTVNGFNEQLTVGVEFRECVVQYCEFGWRKWRFVAERVYVFLNWYYTPVNGYALPAIGGVPYEVVFPQ